MNKWSFKDINSINRNQQLYHIMWIKKRNYVDDDKKDVF